MTRESLHGKKAFIAGIGDDQGFGWAIAKKLADAGAEIIIGTWAPIYKIFTQSLKLGKFENCFNIAKVYPLDASYDTMNDVPPEVRENKRYKDYDAFAVADVARLVEQDFGKIDILVHSLANGPEVKNPLLETSRAGYLAALSASSYSYVSLIRHFGPLMNAGGSILTLTYIASERAVPGYGGGMSSAKAALESDTRTLAFEAGRKWGLRVNAISAGPLGSRAARAIGFIEKMIDYSIENAPLNKGLEAKEVAEAAHFLLSPAASAITGVTLYVDNGLHAMGLAVNSPSIAETSAPADVASTH